MTRPPFIKDHPRLLHARAEALRVAGPSPEVLAYLKRHDLDLDVILAHAGFLNIAPVKFWTGNDGDDGFSFSLDGIPAAVIEAILFEYDGEPQTADLVSWPLHHPHAFVTAMGLNDGADVLGPIAMIHRRGAPLRVHRHPLAWLQAACEGCVPLKPGARYWLRLTGGPYICEDFKHGQSLRELIGAEAAMRNRILVRDSSARAAA